VTGRTGLQGCETSRLPPFPDQWYSNLGQFKYPSNIRNWTQELPACSVVSNRNDSYWGPSQINERLFLFSRTPGRPNVEEPVNQESACHPNQSLASRGEMSSATENTYESLRLIILNSVTAFLLSPNCELIKLSRIPLLLSRRRTAICHNSRQPSLQD
jgi:hypothetical protein